ncbi:hypothetical protein [Lactococcus sp.]|uniref:hypothetical protein n=1 Tax=Lactococcus sp. TaxID=44273 RepID=UPI0035B30D6D
MSKYDINPELNDKLVLSLENQGQFLEDISFVYAMQAFPILVPTKIFYFEIDGHKTLPMFTTEADLAVFEKALTNVETEWELRPIRDVLTALMATDIESVAFNPKLSSDPSNGNTAYFDKKALLEFLGYYTEILNVILDPKNVSADRMERTYLVPMFLRQNAEGDIKRAFASLTSADGRDFIPVFDNLNSFATWYNEAYFRDPFRENGGQVFAIGLDELRHPKDGNSIFANSLGVTINPLDSSIDEYEKTLMTWEEID